MEPAPPTGEKVGEPQPDMEALGGVATTILPGEVGKVSEKATPLSESFWFGFVMVKVNVETPLARTGVGANCFAILGGRTAVREAEARLFLFVPPSVVERNPLTLLCGPAVVAVTFTLAVHEPLAGMLAPVVCPK